MFDFKAQGALEYLLMIGASILVVAVVIIGISGIITQTNDQNVSSDYNTQMQNLNNLINKDYLSINSFTIDGVSGSINKNNITVVFPYSFTGQISSLTPAITITGTSVSPSSGSVQNFSSPVSYTVSDDKGNKKVYVVTVTKQSAPKSSEKQILAFSLTEASASISISQTDHKIDIILDEGRELANSIPSIIISNKASISPASGVMVDLTSPLDYTVTAEDGSTQVYHVVAFPRWSQVYDEKTHDEALSICTNLGGRIPGQGEICENILSLPAKEFWTSTTNNGQFYTIQRSGNYGACSQESNPGYIPNSVICIR